MILCSLLPGHLPSLLSSRPSLPPRRFPTPRSTLRPGHTDHGASQAQARAPGFGLPASRVLLPTHPGVSACLGSGSLHASSEVWLGSGVWQKVPSELSLHSESKPPALMFGSPLVVCAHACMSTCICTHTRARVCMYKHVCTCMYGHVRAHTYE